MRSDSCRRWSRERYRCVEQAHEYGERLTGTNFFALSTHERSVDRKKVMSDHSTAFSNFLGVYPSSNYPCNLKLLLPDFVCAIFAPMAALRVPNSIQLVHTYPRIPG